MIEIVDWNEHFENNRTRELKKLSWVPVPNKMDGSGYTELLDHPDGTAHFGCWIALLEIASKCEPRGCLTKNGCADLSLLEVSRMSKIPLNILQLATERLEKIGWIKGYLEMSQEGAAIPQDDAASRAHAMNGMEGNRKEVKRSKSSKSHSGETPVSPVEEAKADPRIKEIIDYFHDKAVAIGFKPASNYGKSAKLLQKLLKVKSKAFILDMIDKRIAGVEKKDSRLMQILELDCMVEPRNVENYTKWFLRSGYKEKDYEDTERNPSQ